MRVPFNRPGLVGREMEYVREAAAGSHLSGDGPFTKRCHLWLEERTSCRRAFLAHSGTAALEIAALLLDLQPGDEAILPSFTFVSTANAFVLRGAVPVFVDVRPDTLNLDEAKVEAAVTPRTRAIVPVHYGGVACEMEAILDVARRRGLAVVEDAAQGILASYNGRPLGSLGGFGGLSFHESKNVICGEGGALLVNDPRFAERAEILREKGTDRSRFFRGEVDKYTWVDVGSSYLPSEITAAFLLAQLEKAEEITRDRRRTWNLYHEAFAPLQERGLLRRPRVPPGCVHNGHIYWLVLPDPDRRDRLMAALRGKGVSTVFHYIPLHSSPGGRRYGRTHGELRNTEELSARLLRLPLWFGMEEEAVRHVIRSVEEAVGEMGKG